MKKKRSEKEGKKGERKIKERANEAGWRGGDCGMAEVAGDKK